jgi:carbon-monoxide dehydrogenase iron sulfur subunit
MKTVFVNPERCIGCRQCEFACAVEHSRSHDPVQALYETPPPRKRIHVEPGPLYNTSFPNRCRHCDPAPCEQVCPTGAIYRDTELDLVLLEAGKCIACAMCAMVCAFDALTYHPVANGMGPHVVAIKCDGCVDRVRRGEEPACVEACKTSALVFGELNALVKAARLRDTRATLAATTLQEPTAPSAPGTVAGWRAWGRAATHVAAGGVA